MKKLSSRLATASFFALGALVFSAQASAQAAPSNGAPSLVNSCTNPQIAVLYGNGVDNTPQDWVASREALQASIGNTYTVGNHTVCLAYGNAVNPTTVNSSQNILGDIQAAISLVSQALSNGDAYDDATLNSQVAEIKQLLVGQNLKVLLVGHSQGTLYANGDYIRLAADNSVPINNFGIVHVASMASSVAGGGGYITSTNDPIVAAVRFFLPTVLAPNVTLPSSSMNANGSSNDGHDFATYLLPAVGAWPGTPTPIQTLVYTALAKLNQAS